MGEEIGMRREEKLNPLEVLWTDVCDVFGFSECVQEDGSMLHEQVLIFSGLPCRISKMSGLSNAQLRSASQTDTAAEVEQRVKIFLSPEVVIPPGSAITVQRHGRAYNYAQSGLPVVFSKHQEIILELAERWA